MKNILHKQLCLSHSLLGAMPKRKRETKIVLSRKKQSTADDKRKEIHILSLIPIRDLVLIVMEYAQYRDPVPVPLSKSVYRIHDNGDCPFTVWVNQREHLINIHQENQPKKSRIIFPYYQIWCGQGECRSVQESEYEDHEGASVLIEEPEGSILWIGREISRFWPLTKGEYVERFCTPMGRSDVTFPWVRTNRHTYILLHRYAYPNEVIDQYDPDTN